MLKELYIKNLAIIDELRVTFEQGFQVLTGETGAGKTILVEAIGLILGNKASSRLIRDGEAESLVEACFDLGAAKNVKELLEEADLINLEDNNELIIRRHISRQGKNRIFINHQRAAITFLQKLSGLLFDFTGQHQQIQLLDGGNDIYMLDSFLTDKNLYHDYVVQFNRVKNLHEQIKKLNKINREKTERLDWLQFQLKEFEDLKITSAEEESALKKRRERLKNINVLSQFEELLAQNLTGGATSCVGLIQSLKDSLGKNSCLSDVYGQVAQNLDDIQIQIEDLAFDIAKASTKSGSYSDMDLEEIEGRLYQIEKLKRKFGPEVSDVLEKREEIQQQISSLENADETLGKLEKDYQLQIKSLKKLALALSEGRKKIKAKLKNKIKKELEYLLMPGVQFEIEQTINTAPLDSFENYTATGIDKISFLLSPNPGLSPRPLAKIASGGETSRIFLALKQVLAQSRTSGTLIFDEIDTGISGAAVEMVGKKLKILAKSFQVFCVTHQAQIASQADRHFLVQKKSTKKATITRVSSLSEDERVQEIARLMGGVKITEKNVAYAVELLEKNRGSSSETLGNP